ncbi:hypothetical protein CBR_g38787 [Chara braunii]|uniref:Uncharacterized protein n=1 Tax=Chara braunii TaxID=69332 RepID=A0A388LQH8_CHABU|nr:hypothetical protein CBR_g38787 [Chara braunii]|eukprot:GBG84505.1 hypothetical protein CBR_g38787 [Chara braunii]
MENSVPQPPPQVQPPAPPFQTTAAPTFPLFNPHGGFYQQPFPAVAPPFAFAPIGQSVAPAPVQGPWTYTGPSAAPTQGGGQYNADYGRGNGSFQSRAFFTREHADFIEKLKLKDAVEEARKKDREDIMRLRGFGWEIEKPGEKEKWRERESESEKAKVENRGKSKKHVGKDKGKGKVMDNAKEDEMKKWVASNFGGSLRMLSEKMEEVERNSKLKEAELEELKLLRVEKELRELRENSSSEKRKRDTMSPAKPGKGKVRSRSCLLKKGGRGKSTKSVEVSSDEDGKEKDDVVQNLSRTMEGSMSRNKEVSELRDLIKELLAAKGRDASSSNTGGEPEVGNAVVGRGQGEQNGKKVDSDEKLGTNEKRKDKEEGSLGLYFKDRIIYYDAMHYTEVQELCKKKGIPYKRKEAGVWELARLDFEVLLKLDAPDEKDEESEERKSEEEVENSESNSCSEEETQQDDIAGN